MDTNTTQTSPVAASSSTKSVKLRWLGIVLAIVGAVWGILLIIYSVKAGYEYNNQIYSYWSLYTKAATLQAKSQYFDQYVQAIENAHLSGNNALMFKTPDNSYTQNFATLQSAQQRLHEVQTIDPTSFQYSQTLSQVAASGTATLNVFEGIWYLKNYPFIWGWPKLVEVIMAVMFIYFGLILIFTSSMFSKPKAQ
jgi:hypothetical protein